MLAKLKPEIKTLWLEALRSGQYEQGVAALRSAENKFCCLGVLCDIAAKHNMGEWVEDTPWRFEISGTADTVLIPPPIVDWAFEVQPHTRVDYWDLGEGMVADGKSLANLNDHGTTFEEIANIIEKEL
jgi:hypothetical protein